MLRQSIFAALAIAAATGANGQVSASPATGKANVYYEFKGARLGMSLAEWKAAPASVWSAPIAAVRYGPSQAVCSGDQATSGRFGLSLERSRAEEASNVVVCTYGRQAIGMAFKPWMNVPISIGEFATREVRYKFLEGRMYEISIVTHTNLLKDVLDGLTAKWGKPDSVMNDTTQNRLGATFPHTIQLWANPVATVRLESPTRRIDELNVTYVTVDGAAKIRAVEKTINPDANKM